MHNFSSLLIGKVHSDFKRIEENEEIRPKYLRGDIANHPITKVSGRRFKKNHSRK